MMSDIWAACPWSSVTVPMVATFMPLESPSIPAVGPGKLNSLHGGMWGETSLHPFCSWTSPQHLLRGTVEVPRPAVPWHLLCARRIPYLHL